MANTWGVGDAAVNTEVGVAPPINQNSGWGNGDVEASGVTAAAPAPAEGTKATPDQLLPAAPYDATDAAVHGMTLGLSDMGRAAMQAGVRYLTGQTPGYDYGAASQEVQRGREAYAAQHPWLNAGANIAGAVTGPVGGAANLIKAASPLGKIAAGAATGGGIGAVQGAADNSDTAANALAGAERGGETGLALGGAIPLAGTIGRALVPEMTPQAQILRAADVQPTPGSAVGGVPGVLENFASKIPLIGSPIQAARGAAQGQFAHAVAQNAEDFNRGTINYALEPIGESLDPNTNVGNDAFAELRQKASDAYKKAVPTAGGAFDQQAADSLNNAVAGARLTLPKTQADQFANFVDTNIQSRINQPQTLPQYMATPNGTMSGDAFKEADEMLGKEASDYLYNPKSDPDQRKLGLAYQQLQGNLRDWLARVTPQNAADIQAANQSWARMLRVQNATNLGDKTTGQFTPKNLMQAVKNYSSDAQFAQGTAPMQDVARNALLKDQAFAQAGKSLPSPSGGTPGFHGAVTNGGIGLSLLGANLAERMLENPSLETLAIGGATYPALAALYSNPGRSAINGLLSAGSNIPSMAPLAPFVAQRAAQ